MLKMGLYLVFMIITTIGYPLISATDSMDEFKDCGIKSNFFLLPWHVAIYNDKYQYICGGTLINPKTVITAAHCVRQTPKNYHLAIGNTQLAWKHMEDANTAQYVDASKIQSHPIYHDQENNYNSDIAIITTDKALNYTERVRPVCVSLSSAAIPTENAVGFLPTWGPTESVTFLNHIRPVPISLEECYRLSPNDFKPFITADKFCTNYKDGELVAGPGDGGTGLTMIENGRHFLKGVTSLGPSNRNKDSTKVITLFTSVPFFVEWLNNSIDIPKTYNLPPGPENM